MVILQFQYINRICIRFMHHIYIYIYIGETLYIYPPGVSRSMSVSLQ